MDESVKKTNLNYLKTALQIGLMFLGIHLGLVCAALLETTLGRHQYFYHILCIINFPAIYLFQKEFSGALGKPLNTLL